MMTVTLRSSKLALARGREGGEHVIIKIIINLISSSID